MDWIHDFDLFLFDFDGLLVNTEHLHYQAYFNMLLKRGIRLELSFANFCELAHFSSRAWKEALYAQIPELDPNWQSLYEEKKLAYSVLLASAPIELMPGVEKLLKELEKFHKRRVVVTHSVIEHVAPIRARLNILKTIPHWVTREVYEKPKPNPECYLKAIELYGQKGDRIIGFEDSVRGLKALLGTPARALLIRPKHHPLLEMAMGEVGEHFESIHHIGFRSKKDP